MTRKSVSIPNKLENFKKHHSEYYISKKVELKNEHENDIDLPFYLTFPTGIYLFKINNENRKRLC